MNSLLISSMVFKSTLWRNITLRLPCVNNNFLTWLQIGWQLSMLSCYQPIWSYVRNSTCCFDSRFDWHQHQLISDIQNPLIFLKESCFMCFHLFHCSMNDQTGTVYILPPCSLMLCKYFKCCKPKLPPDPNHQYPWSKYLWSVARYFFRCC